MIRLIKSWTRPSFSPDDQLEDLIDHLFVMYATPVFLITAFYESSRSRMLWYIRLEQVGFLEYLTAKMTPIFKETLRGYNYIKY